ncbi:MAG: hypothetical protein SF051_13695 [Elusimicrobiota bacterium]|nr:hypothetical protein [Elusimicrobiota bacterium]
MSALVLAALLAWPAAAASPFLEALRRAESRAASDPERVEFATRAIRAWLPGDGRLMLSHAYLRRAEALLLSREDAAAAEDLTQVMANDPGNKKARLLRGRARLAAGKPFDAEVDFAEYAAAEPEDAEGWLGLAEARVPLAGKARPPEARKAAARARRLAPADWRADWLEGRAWRLEGRPEAALPPLEAAVARAKGARAEPHAERAVALAALGRHAEAAAEWGRVIPLYERTLVEGDRTRAAAKARQADRARLADAYVARGRLHDFLLDHDAARADFNEACELGRADACERLKRAAAAPAAAKRRPATARPEPAAPPEPKSKPRRRKPVRSEPGERVYGS